MRFIQSVDIILKELVDVGEKMVMVCRARKAWRVRDRLANGIGG